MKIINVEQGTPEWFAARDLKGTASHATAIGNIGKGLETYANKVASEHYSSKSREQWTNEHLDRGVELEPLARQIYEMDNDVEVETVGFMEHNAFIGASPDGFVGKDGGIEIKCPDDDEYLLYLRFGADNIKSDYHWQIQMNLLISGRKWWDLIVYNPNFKKSMLVYRIVPDVDKFEKLKLGFVKFEQIIKSIINVVEK